MDNRKKDCVICNPDLIPEQKMILSNDHCIFFQMPQKILIGSGIIVPKIHRRNVFELTDEEVLATFHLLAEVKSYLDEKFKPDGYNPVSIDIDNIYSSKKDLSLLKEQFKDFYEHSFHFLPLDSVGKDDVEYAKEFNSKNIPFDSFKEIIEGMFDYAYQYLMEYGFHIAEINNSDKGETA